MIEGSARKANNRVRITARLIEAVTGNHLWAERYDRELEDVFAVQDEITQNVVATIAPELIAAETARARRKSPDNLDAWDYYLRAMWHYQRQTRENNVEAMRLAEHATRLDPDVASDFSVLALCHLVDALYAWSESRDQSLAAGLEAAKRAVARDNGDAVANASLGLANLYLRRHDVRVKDSKGQSSSIRIMHLRMPCLAGRLRASAIERARSSRSRKSCG